MGLDDDVERFVVGEGDITFSFDSEQARDKFLKTLQNMAEQHDRIEAEGYVCGNCAAYSCFRRTLFNEPAGLCFQNVKQCRQECKNYDYGEFPASGGTCKVDNHPVKYKQECHIPKMKKSRL